MNTTDENQKIYTKTGDSGETSLIGGRRVQKFDIRVEAYGTLDELNAHLGVVFDSVTDSNSKKNLQIIIENIFKIESIIALDPHSKCKIKLEKINQKDIDLLENEIDQMNKVLPKLSNFILPGGNLSASFCHVARCVCRRAERNILHVNSEEAVEEIILKYMNRLSDYLFILSRYICFQQICDEKKWVTK